MKMKFWKDSIDFRKFMKKKPPLNFDFMGCKFFIKSNKFKSPESYSTVSWLQTLLDSTRHSARGSVKL